MTQAILSAFVLGSAPTSAVFGFSYTLFDPVQGSFGAPRFIFPSVEQQTRTGRTVSDLGVVDLATAPECWGLMDPSQMVSPRDAALQLANTLNRCACVWVPELGDVHHILDSFSQQYVPECNGRTYGNTVQCAEFATRDCSHDVIIDRLCMSYARQA